MTKKIFIALVTIGLEVLVSSFIANKSGMLFIDAAFFVGIFGTFIIFFLNSSGGFSTDIVDSKIQGSTGMKMARQDFIFNRGIAFTTSLIFFIVMSIAVWIVHYN